MLQIQHDEDTWNLIGQGAVRNGRVYCHLASTTRTRQQRNGSVPVQMADWIDQNVILIAAMDREEAQRKTAALEHKGPCVPWRGRDGELGRCIYCGERADAITAYYTDRANGVHANRAR